MNNSVTIHIHNTHVSVFRNRWFDETDDNDVFIATLILIHCVHFNLNKYKNRLLKPKDYNIRGIFLPTNLWKHELSDTLREQIVSQVHPRGLLPSTTKLRQGNVFTPVCHSVHGGGSGRHPIGQTPPPGRWPLQWTVRIILECILVIGYYWLRGRRWQWCVQDQSGISKEMCDSLYC